MASMMTVDHFIDMDMDMEMDAFDIEPAAVDLHDAGDFHLLACTLRVSTFI